VKRGEKGILILAPMIGGKKTDDVAESTADTKEVTAQLYGFRAVYVFDDYLVICAPVYGAAAGSRVGR
jgi:hypothetical protein